MAKKKQSSRGRKQDRARVAAGQDYEVGYESKKTGSRAAVKKTVKKVTRAAKRAKPVAKKAARSAAKTARKVATTLKVAGALLEEGADMTDSVAGNRKKH